MSVALYVDKNVSYTPVALLGTQTTSGINYVILCEASPDSDQEESFFIVVVFHKDTQANVTVIVVGPIETEYLSETAWFLAYELEDIKINYHVNYHVWHVSHDDHFFVDYNRGGAFIALP